jgi:hypothetical protein
MFTKCHFAAELVQNADELSLPCGIDHKASLVGIRAGVGFLLAWTLGITKGSKKDLLLSYPIAQGLIIWLANFSYLRETPRSNGPGSVWTTTSVAGCIPIEDVRL